MTDEKRRKLWGYVLSSQPSTTKHVLGYLRYETLRKLTPHAYQKLVERSIKNNIEFDDLVDNLIVDTREDNR